GASEASIKKAYRKLSLILHPDKETGNEKAFMKLTKAYQALTVEESRHNWEKYGNPDGPGAMSFGIALPSWIVEKENSVWVLGLYALVFMVALPVAVGMWWYRSIKYTSDQVLLDTTQMYYFFFHKTPSMPLKRVIMILAASLEFEKKYNSEIVERQSDNEEVPHWYKKSETLCFEIFNVISSSVKYCSNIKIVLGTEGNGLSQMIGTGCMTSTTSRGTQRLIKQIGNLGEKNKERPLCYLYSIKARALIYAHLSRMQLNPLTLDKDRMYIVRKCPYLIQEMVNCVSQLIMMGYARRVHRVIRVETIEWCMKLCPMIVQALWEYKSPLLQLPHVNEDNIKYFLSKKRYIKSIQQFAQLKNEDRRSILRLFTEEQYNDVMKVIAKMPLIDFQVRTEGEDLCLLS
ncbi:secretory subunit, partial [Homalodisca vitripennis]